MTVPRVAFAASTGRTATTLLAATLADLPGVAAFHEGHDPIPPREARLPLVNLQNGPAWFDHDLAARTVAERRDRTTLAAAAGAADLVVDVAFYNAPLLRALAEHHPGAPLVVVFRRCESFVRSATVVEGEDRQPAGWPDPGKPLTDRERFVELGRLRPRPPAPEAERWPDWSGVERNIWLWHAINSRLAALVDDLPQATALHYEWLVDEPRRFWSHCLSALGLDAARHLPHCLARSRTPVNARSTYQVGPATTWSRDERRLHRQLAQPLEEQLYGSAA